MIVMLVEHIWWNSPFTSLGGFLVYQGSNLDSSDPESVLSPPVVGQPCIALKQDYLHPADVSVDQPFLVTRATIQSPLVSCAQTRLCASAIPSTTALRHSSYWSTVAPIEP